MHLKCYQIGGRVLRIGAANFSASGLKRQDTDLIVIESAGAAAAFKHAFNVRFASGDVLPSSVKQQGRPILNLDNSHTSAKKYGANKVHSRTAQESCAVNLKIIAAEIKYHDHAGSEICTNPCCPQSRPYFGTLS
jgi:hypothetical protein